MSYIFAIDPGNIESGYVILEKGTLKPVEIGKIENELLLEKVKTTSLEIEFAIEMIASYGMAVGQTVFDTCRWVGRFEQAIIDNHNKYTLIYRKDVKLKLCYSMKAKDSNIIQALIDRFAPNVRNKGKGTKKEQGFFYGFKKDIWQAYAVGVTYSDLYLN